MYRVVLSIKLIKNQSMFNNRFFTSGINFKKIIEIFGRPNAFAYLLVKVKKNKHEDFHRKIKR